MSTERNDTSWDADQLRRQLQAMDDYDFEHFIGDLWELQGWDTEVEQQSTDAGVDVRATQTSPYYRKVLIQAKRYSDDNPVSGPDVQQYSALKQQEADVDESIIVTTGRFTGSAEDRGKDLNVKLIDGHGLVAIIDEFNAYDIVEQYIRHPGTNSSQPAADQSQSHRSTQSDIPSEERSKVEKHMEQDIDSYLEDDEYRATRARERAQAQVELNPHDAQELGVFDNLPLYDFEREFTKRKQELVLLKDDVHMDDDGEVYVEDLTDYIDADAIRGAQSGAVIGVIRRGVQDGAWVSEQGENLWENQKRNRRLKRMGRNLISSLKTDNTEDTASSAVDIQKNEAPEGPDSAPVNQAPEKSPANEVSSEAATVGSPSTNTESSTQDSFNQQDEQEETIESDSRPEGSITAESNTDETVATTLDLTRTNWFYGVAVGTAGWMLVWGLYAVLPSAELIGGSLTLLSWLLLPIAIFADTRETGAYTASRAKSIAYVVLSAIPLFAVIPGAVYLYRRENSWSS